MISAVNFGRRLAILEDQTVVPITNMFDEDGDETDQPSDAVTFVAGPTGDGQWITDEVASFDFKIPHQVN